MITKSDLLKSNHLVLQDIENKQLSIQFSLDGFSFCITAIDLNEIIAFRKYTFTNKTRSTNSLLENIKTIFNEDTTLHESFTKVLVIHVNDLSTFVPKPLFKEREIANYIKFNTQIFTSDYFTYDEIKSQEMVSVFAPYINVNNFLIDRFGGFEYKHFSSVLVENLMNTYAENNNINFFVNVAKSHFEIIISNHKKLLLYNTFNYKTKEDFIYYILFTIEQLKLNVEEVSLILLGNIKKDDELYTIAYKYIRNVSFLDDKLAKTTILQINETVKRENFSLLHAIS